MQNRFRKLRAETALPAPAEVPLGNSLWLQVLTACFWLMMLVAPGAAGVWAVMNLLELPVLPQCWASSWSDTTSATRLYCAKEQADKQTIPDLQQAIKLVNNIPTDDPLRDEGMRLTQKWAKQLLDLADEKFQAGQLDDAIAIARDIPHSKLATDRIQQWQTAWDKAEGLYRDGQSAIEQQHWYDVLASARGLLTVGNHYWATTQRDELMRQMQIAKDSQQQQRKALRPPQPKPTDDFLAQMDRDRAAEAREHLAKARRLAQSGDRGGLQAAVNEAQQLFFGDPLYNEAQQAIDTWNHQIELLEDGPILQRAKALAAKGDVDSLQAAIQEANQISWGRSLYTEAQSQIDQWRDRSYSLEAEARSQKLQQMGIEDPAPPSRSPVAIPVGNSPATQLDTTSPVQPAATP